ncbi:neuronal acetylcholine receptor subunit alpha-9-like precursor [Plakobranchus ocellatus]|uniref:Neuronal acetylcholine receptor subunit alpha-9-like n=1 Tax=Plakobranchus ocellatus TaxID=259542 RepID=A0AAV3ZMD9_9GAST|nr:neuronal acetylcholine receptor subunit alpha-9-like precursor [Plakobranchus ocellatus]
MTVDDYKEMFGKLPKLEPSKVCPRNYTCELIQSLGTLLMNVDIKRTRANLTLLILNKGADSILKRYWLSVLKLDWRSINHICKANGSSVNSIISEYLDVFAQGIWKIKKFEAHIEI